MNRRRFLANTLVASGALAFPHIRRISAKELGADRINTAYIGVGGHGRYAALGNPKENTVAFCDIDDAFAAKVYQQAPDVPRFRDFRKLFDALGSQIQAVNIATPDHTHFPIAMEALQRGYHVYLEKPMAHSIAEIRMLQAAAIKYDRVTQLGIQGRSMAGLLVLKEWLDTGVIGKVIDVHLWTDRPKPRDFHTYETDAPAQAIPETLDWDLWLGPTRQRNYNEIYTPAKWRGWWDFGSGPLGDIGAHMWDVVEYSLQIGYPKTVTAENPRDSEVGTPRWCKVDYFFDADPGQLAPAVHWYSGERDGKPHLPLNLPYWPANQEIETRAAMYFVGTEGAIYFPSMRAESAPTILPDSRWKEFRRNLPPPTLPRQKGGHHTEFFNAIRENRKANADFSYGGPLNESVLIGNLALRTGRTIHWDAENMEAVGVPEADKYIQSPEPRKGWEYRL